MIQPQDKTVIDSPKAFSAVELDAFVALVNEGGEVGGDLMDRVKRAAILAMLYDDDKLIGTAGIKNPYCGYHHDVFSKSKSGLNADDYPRELGWIYVSEQHRRRKLAGHLIDSALKGFQDCAIFGTARSDNEGMHRLFCKQHFKRVGIPYPSDEHSDKKIVLYVRDALK